MLTLFDHPLDSYCHKVLVALYENGTTFQKRIIDLGDPAQRAELQALWPFAKFPVIRDAARDRTVAETSVIIEYLDRHYGGRQPLLPLDFEQALEVRLRARFSCRAQPLPLGSPALRAPTWRRSSRPSAAAWRA